jgi:hypothetical protein
VPLTAPEPGCASLRPGEAVCSGFERSDDHQARSSVARQMPASLRDLAQPAEGRDTVTWGERRSYCPRFWMRAM